MCLQRVIPGPSPPDAGGWQTQGVSASTRPTFGKGPGRHLQAFLISACAFTRIIRAAFY